VVNLITRYYATISNADFQRVGYIRSVLDKTFPGGFTDIPLSQAALNAVRSIEGTSSVLIGARSVEYVDDVLLALQKKTSVYDRADWLGMKLH
jgi:aryl-alcohol dehydrogenase-like predicted oxidoreductase